MTAKATCRRQLASCNPTSRRHTLRVTTNSKPCGLPMSFAGAKSIEFVNQLCNVSDCQLVNIPGCVGAVHDVKPPNNLLAVIRRNAADFNGDISRIGIAKIARFRAAQIFEERDRIAIVKIVFGCDLACLAPVRLCPPAFAAGSTGIFPLNYHDTSGLKGLHAKVSRVAVTIIFHVVAPFLLVERGRLCYNSYTVPRSGGLVGLLVKCFVRAV